MHSDVSLNWRRTYRGLTWLRSKLNILSAEKEKSSKFADNGNVNNKLPMCEGQFKPKKYVDKTHWVGVLTIVTEELLLVEDKPLNTYKERDELASAVREKMNQRAGKEDMFSILVIGSDIGVSYRSNGRGKQGLFIKRCIWIEVKHLAYQNTSKYF